MPLTLPPAPARTATVVGALPAALLAALPPALLAALLAMPGAPASAQILATGQYLNGTGVGEVVLQQGAVNRATHPFFQSLGTNGRSCASCHAPEDAMSLSAASAQRRWLATAGRDPLFAPIDGANCPKAVPAALTGPTFSGGDQFTGRTRVRSAYSLLLQRGLFRVALPMPTTTSDLRAVGGEAAHPVEFTVTVVSDPYGCNTDPAHATKVDPATGAKTQWLSVYRRPRMAANLKFMTTPALTLGNGALPNIDMVTLAPVVHPTTGQPISGNLMWDGREPTLESQAISATLGHAQASRPPTADQVAQIVAFENSVFAAQMFDFTAGDLRPGFGSTVTGGAAHLSLQPVSFGNFSTFDAWLNGGARRAPARASIQRGQALFNTRPITVGNVAGFNNAVGLGVTNPTTTTCSSCHGGLQAGSDPFPAGQRDIGVGGHAKSLGGPDLDRTLPVFKVSCRAPYTTAFLGREVLTNDPGLALVTGRCADVGRKSVPQLRALASRAPFFSDGSAASLPDVVRVYNQRFKMGLTPSEVNDLANFLKAL